MLKALLLGALTAAAPLWAHNMADMGSMSDAVKKAASYCLIINRDSADVNLYEIATGKSNKIFLDKFAAPHMGMISPDGRVLVVSGSGNNTIYLIDMATMKILNRIKAYGEPEHMDITPDSKYVFCGSMEGGVVQAIDLQTYQEAKAIEGFHEPHGYSTLPDNSKIYISNIGAHEVTVVDVKRLEVLKRISVGAPSEPASLNPNQYLGAINGIINPTLTVDGKLCYAADGDFGTVTVIDTTTDKVIDTIPVGTNPWRGYASPDGKYILVPVSGDQVVAVIDAHTHKLVSKMPAGANMTGVNYSSDGKKAYVISHDDDTEFIYNLEKMSPAGKLFFGENKVLETATTDEAANKIYLCSSTDDTIIVIDCKDDSYKHIYNVGNFPWGSHIMGSNDNYCH
jgi:YVTN family beta-propeller protein